MELWVRGAVAPGDGDADEATTRSRARTLSGLARARLAEHIDDGLVAAAHEERQGRQA